MEDNFVAFSYFIGIILFLIILAIMYRRHVTHSLFTSFGFLGLSLLLPFLVPHL